MAIGLTVIAPMLSYLDTSYSIYLGKIIDTQAYYTVDAMMGKIFTDLYAGQDAYVLNQTESTRYSNQSFLNGFQVITTINNSLTGFAANVSLPTSTADWIYMDPGCYFGLNSLAHNDNPAYAYNFSMYLTAGTTAMANWYFQDSHSGSCNYNCIGRIWIEYQNGSTVADTTVSTFINTAFQKNVSYSVPWGYNGLYYIKFQNLATRQSGSGCSTTNDRSMSQMYIKPTFNGAGTSDPDYQKYTWVRMGNASGGQVYQYQDYTISTKARINNADIASITACLRQSPGPSLWWEHQTLTVVSWTVTYY